MLMIKYVGKDLLFKAYSEQEDIIEFKSKRNATLENLLKRNNIKCPQDMTLTDKYNSKKGAEKVYIPYQMENNDKGIGIIVIYVRIHEFTLYST